jgi:uncharacterized protein (TIGR02145 family)
MHLKNEKMKKKIKLLVYPLVILFISGILTSSCKKDKSELPTAIFNSSLTYGTVTDQDGNVYKTIKIGTQTWMAENLRTTKYNDGTSIFNVTDDGDWINIPSGAYCWYNNDVSNKATYGALYNWYALNATTNGNKSICPAGWHIPSDAEWTTLNTYLGTNTAGAQLKEIGSTHWQATNTGDNSSGFTALPSGFRNSNDGTFSGMGIGVYFWTSTGYGTDFAHHRYLDYAVSYIFVNSSYKNSGYTIRCVKD